MAIDSVSRATSKAVQLAAQSTAELGRGSATVVHDEPPADALGDGKPGPNASIHGESPSSILAALDPPTETSVRPETARVKNPTEQINIFLLPEIVGKIGSQEDLDALPENDSARLLIETSRQNVGNYLLAGFPADTLVDENSLAQYISGLGREQLAHLVDDLANRSDALLAHIASQSDEVSFSRGLLLDELEWLQGSMVFALGHHPVIAEYATPELGLAEEFGLAVNQPAFVVLEEDGVGVEAFLRDVYRPDDATSISAFVEVTPREVSLDPRLNEAIDLLFPGQTLPSRVFQTDDASYPFRGSYSFGVPIVNPLNIATRARSEYGGAGEPIDALIEAEVQRVAANELGHLLFDERFGGVADDVRLRDYEGLSVTHREVYELISDAVSSQVAEEPVLAALRTEAASYALTRSVASKLLADRGHSPESYEALSDRATKAEIDDAFRAYILEVAEGYVREFDQVAAHSAP
ncbi:MAG: hypothetical protein AAF658_13385 [Myxococcota bacterium]